MPVLVTLHHLPVPFRTDVNVIPLVFKAFNGFGKANNPDSVES